MWFCHCILCWELLVLVPSFPPKHYTLILFRINQSSLPPITPPQTLTERQQWTDPARSLLGTPIPRPTGTCFGGAALRTPRTDQPAPEAAPDAVGASQNTSCSSYTGPLALPGEKSPRLKTTCPDKASSMLSATSLFSRALQAGYLSARLWVPCSGAALPGTHPSAASPVETSRRRHWHPAALAPPPARALARSLARSLRRASFLAQDAAAILAPRSQGAATAHGCPSHPLRRSLQPVSPSGLRRGGRSTGKVAANRRARCGGVAANRLLASSGVRWWMSLRPAVSCWHRLLSSPPLLPPEASR